MECRKTLTAIGVVASLAALSACTSSGSPVSPNGNETSNTNALEVQISNDVAASTGQGVVSDIDQTGNDGADDNGAYAAVMAPRGFMTTGGTVSADGRGMGSASCTQTGLPSDLRYYCTPDTLAISNSSGSRADTLIRQWNYEYFAEDTAQSLMDTYTDSINFGGPNGVLVYAAMHSTRWHGVSHRIRNHSATDHPSFSQDTEKQTAWNGNTLATDTTSFTGTRWSINYTGVAYDTTADMIFQRPRGEHPFPLSGQFHRWVTWMYTAQGPSSASGTISRHIVVTYNGTDTAVLQVLGATTLTCDVNLVTGDVFDCH